MTKKKSNKGKKYDKPVKIPGKFDDAMRRLSRVSKEDIDRLERRIKPEPDKPKKPRK